MKCMNCKTEVKADAKFCPSCGGEVRKSNKLPINFKDKKVIIGGVCLLAVVVLLISGSSKKLTCSMTEYGNYGEYTFTFNSKGTKITSLTVVGETRYTSDVDLDEYKEDICGDDDIKFKSCKVTRKGNKIRLSAKVDGKYVSDMTDGEISKNTSYKKVKKIMKEEGLKCK